jgi:hypothetical protein
MTYSSTVEKRRAAVIPSFFAANIAPAFSFCLKVFLELRLKKFLYLLDLSRKSRVVLQIFLVSSLRFNFELLAQMLDRFFILWISEFEAVRLNRLENPFSLVVFILVYLITSFNKQSQINELILFIIWRFFLPQISLFNWNKILGSLGIVRDHARSFILVSRKEL